MSNQGVPPGQNTTSTQDSTQGKGDGKTEYHRYIIATVLILGMILMIFVPVLRNDFTSAKDMAGIFSGWIVSIVGFYFLQQNAEKAQTSSSDAIKSATSAANQAAGASKKLVGLAAENEANIADFQRFISDHVKQLREHKDPGVRTLAARNLQPTLEELVRESDRKANYARDRVRKLLAD